MHRLTLSNYFVKSKFFIIISKFSNFISVQLLNVLKRIFPKPVQKRDTLWTSTFFAQAITDIYCMNNSDMKTLLISRVACSNRKKNDDGSGKTFSDDLEKM